MTARWSCRVRCRQWSAVARWSRVRPGVVAEGVTVPGASPGRKPLHRIFCLTGRCAQKCPLRPALPPAPSPGPGRAISNGPRDGPRTREHAAMSTPAFVIGNITRTPQLSHTGDGTPVVNLSLAENTRRLVDGEWVDGTTTYWEVVCFVRPAGREHRRLAAPRRPRDRGRHVPHPHLARRRRRRAVPAGDRRRRGRPFAALGHRPDHQDRG